MFFSPSRVVLICDAPARVRTELSSDAWSGIVSGIDKMSDEESDDMMSVSRMDSAGSDDLSCGEIRLRRFMMVGGLHCRHVWRSNGVFSGSS